jgi:hypothetical protein
MDRYDFAVLFGILGIVAAVVSFAMSHHTAKEQECFSKGGAVYSRSICYPPSAVIKM